MISSELPDLTVDLIRHSESLMNVEMADPNIEPFIGGRQNEIDISQLGEQQSYGLGRYALNERIVPTRVLASPARRALRTADISLRVMYCELPVTVDLRLQELDQGDWTNAPRTIYDEPAVKQAMDELEGDFIPPGGESMNQVVDRGLECLDEIPIEDEQEHAWVFTHGVLIKAIVGRLSNWSHEQTYKTPIENASITRMVKHGGLWQVKFVNRRTS